MASSRDLALVIPEDKIREIRKQAVFKEIVNTEPPYIWVRTNKFANNSKYLPIDKIELMLDTVFTDWQIEIKSVTQLAQSICAIVRVHYKDPVSQEWRYHDGVGGQELKTDKGFSAASLDHIKTDAVRAGAPAAVSRAIRDACEHIGKLFGRDLNRQDAATFHSAYVGEREEESIWPKSSSGASTELLVKLAQMRSEKTAKPLMDSIKWAFGIQSETEVQQWIDHFQCDGPVPGEKAKKMTEQELKKKVQEITGAVIGAEEAEEPKPEQKAPAVSETADDAYDAAQEAAAEAQSERMRGFQEREYIEAERRMSEGVYDY